MRWYVFEIRESGQPKSGANHNQSIYAKNRREAIQALNDRLKRYGLIGSAESVRAIRERPKYRRQHVNTPSRNVLTVDLRMDNWRF